MFYLPLTSAYSHLTSTYFLSNESPNLNDRSLLLSVFVHLNLIVMLSSFIISITYTVVNVVDIF